MGGAGKSVTVCDLLSQTEGYFDYTVIIEEGLSYGLYTQTVEPNARPIIIQPDGDLTINYLDTHQLGDGCNYRTPGPDIYYHDYSTGFRCCADIAQ